MTALRHAVVHKVPQQGSVVEHGHATHLLVEGSCEIPVAGAVAGSVVDGGVAHASVRARVRGDRAHAHAGAALPLSVVDVVQVVPL